MVFKINDKLHFVLHLYPYNVVLQLCFCRREGWEVGWGGSRQGVEGGKRGRIGLLDLHILELPLDGYKTGVD